MQFDLLLKIVGGLVVLEVDLSALLVNLIDFLAHLVLSLQRLVVHLLDFRMQLCDLRAEDRI